MKNHKTIRTQLALALSISILCSSVFMLEGCTDVNSSNSSSTWEILGTVAISDGIQLVRNDPRMEEGGYTKNGFYRPVIQRKDSSYNICYTDFESGQEIVLCSQLNCRHNDESCSAWENPWSGYLRTIPVGNQVVLLHSGDLSYFDKYGEKALASIELMNADGTNRQRIHTFSPTEVLATTPNAGMARDAENLYFATENVSEGETAAQHRTLYRLNVTTKELTAIYEMCNEEEHIVGGCGQNIILEYTPNAYDFTLPMTELRSHVISLNPQTGETVPLFEHSFTDVGMCADGKYLLFHGKDMNEVSRQKTKGSNSICTYNLTTGELLAEHPVIGMENFNWTGARAALGCSEGKLLVWGQREILPEEEASALIEKGKVIPQMLFGIDKDTGEAVRLNWYYTVDEKVKLTSPCMIVAETADHYFLTCGETWDAARYKLPDGEVRETSQMWYSYGFISKQDFWAGTGEITPVIAATK